MGLQYNKTGQPAWLPLNECHRQCSPPPSAPPAPAPPVVEHHTPPAQDQSSPICQGEYLTTGFRSLVDLRTWGPPSSRVDGAVRECLGVSKELDSSSRGTSLDESSPNVEGLADGWVGLDGASCSQGFLGELVAWTGIPPSGLASLLSAKGSSRLRARIWSPCLTQVVPSSNKTSADDELVFLPTVAGTH